jgi:hypothetical protein
MAAEGNSGHRKAFLIGTLLGGAAGAGAALWNAPKSGRATRDQIQTRIEGVLFRVLDMRPSRVSSSAETPAVEGEAATQLEPMPMDIVLDGPRPAADAHA